MEDLCGDVDVFWDCEYGVCYFGEYTLGVEEDREDSDCWLLQFFTPTIIAQLGYKAEQAQVRSIPIFIVATVFCVATAYLTDRLRHRYSFTLLGCVIATVGYAILLAQTHGIPAGVQYFAIFLIVTGGYMCQPVTLAWVSNCMGGHYKRSVSSAVMVSNPLDILQDYGRLM